ncbi:MAG: amidohydrolase family protein [Bacteroidota bacterium]
MIYDAHLHVESGMDSYQLEIDGGNVIYNYVSSYQELRHLYPSFEASLIFDIKDNLEFVLQEGKAQHISAYKIHNRLQGWREEDLPELIEKLALASDDIPIIYDAFPFGPELDCQPSLAGLIKLATTFPKRKFVAAHAGGYDILKYFFHLKPLENVYMELSFSLQYLYDSSLAADLKKVCRFFPSERIFFGTDYPFAHARFQLEILEGILTELNKEKEEIEGILFHNARDFYRKKDHE